MQPKWKSEPTTDRDQPSRVSEQMTFRLKELRSCPYPLTLVMSSPQLRLGVAAKIYQPPILFPYATTAVHSTNSKPPVSVTPA